ncbi:MAG: hypothetical protein EAY65_02305 [Alphaproteobacteria bacterium]|nr:MAG: hypothetical protein EAY65_02305 [Alphaproteobacteria bacterium]
MIKASLFCLRWLRRLVLTALGLMLLSIMGLGAWFVSAPRTVPFGHDAIEYLMMHRLGAEELSFDPPTFYIHLSKNRVESEIRSLHARFGETHIGADRIVIALPLTTLLTAHIAYDGVFADGLTIMPPHEELPITLPFVRINPDADNTQENQLDIIIKQGESIASVQGTVGVRDHAFFVKAQLDDVPARLVAVLHSDLEGLSMKIDGTIDGIIKKNMRIKSLNAQLSSPDILFAHPLYYPKKPLHLQDFSVNLAWDSVHRALNITHGVVRPTKGATLEFQAWIARADEDAHMQINLTKFPVGEVKYIWPKNVAAEARRWVVRSIKDGVITKGKADIHIREDEPNLEAELLMRDMKVRYAKHLPEVRDGRGTAKFTQDNMHITIDEAHSLSGGVVRKGIVEIPSFSDRKRGVPMLITLPVAAPAQDVAMFMSEKHLNIAQKLSLRPDAASGAVEGMVKLGFPLEPADIAPNTHSFDYLDIEIDASLQDVSHMRVLSQWDIHQFNGTVHVDNQRVTLDGTLGLQGIPSTLVVSYDYSGARKHHAQYSIKAQLKDDQLPLLNIPIPKGIVQGTTHLDATIASNPSQETTKARLDFTDATLNIPQIEWSKPLQQPATLEVTQQNYADRKELEKVHFSTKDAELSGRVTLAKDGSIHHAALDRIHSPRMDIALEYYGDNPDQHRVRIHGERMYFYVGKDKKAEVSASAQPWNLINPEHYVLGRDIEISLKELATNLDSMRDVRMRIECSKTLCDSMNVQAHYGKGATAHAYLVRNDQQVRTVQGHVSDLGALARMFNLSSQIAGGGASFQGAYEGTTLQGALTIKDVAIKELPALTNLLTLASLRGIGDTISGDGIAFDTIATNMTYDGTRFALTKGAAKGDALGIMLEGWIEPYGKARLDLSGTLIPSYTLNSLPARVPILGELLMGGENQGVFATRFSVRGAAHDPSVMINPLSMLTPGFLRNIFSVFPDVQPIEEQEKPHEPAS